MKRVISLTITIALLLTLGAGCDKSTDADPSSSNGDGSSANAASDSFEPQRKTESVTADITDSMIPQVIEKSITYVQKTEDGDWEEESRTITKWEIQQELALSDTVWTFGADDITTVFSIMDDSFKGKSGKCFLHFGNEVKDVQTQVVDNGDDTSKMDITFNTSVDVFFECWGTKYIFESVPVTGAEAREDGSIDLKASAPEIGDVVISIPSSVQSSTWKDMLIAESETYITGTTFDSLSSFTVSSPQVNNGFWDTKITNTKYGENMSPELTWDAVDGASKYVVIMIDGSWLHMDVYTTETTLVAGAFAKGERGAQYVGPYPPAGSPHTYSVFVFALKNETDDPLLLFDMGNNSIDSIYQDLDKDTDGNTGNVIAYGRLDGNYTYPG
ncbi:MAG: hypothetical protein J5379_09100 [Clostridiales bacterium]|nr:hypothetical protein [Clostridiales bacterium]